MTALVEKPTRFGAKDSSFLVENASWRIFAEERKYECRALVCPEEDGGYSAFALQLPGVVAQGESIDEALANLSEAFRGCLLAYEAGKMEIPWESLDIERPKGSVERWILVNV